MLDESAMAVIALSCSSKHPDVTDAVTKTIKFMYKQRNSQGSYGNIYTTSLVLQVGFVKCTVNCIMSLDHQIHNSPNDQF